MMTFKDLKKLVELPSYKEQRVPTVKALEVSGVPVVTETVLILSWRITRKFRAGIIRTSRTMWSH